MLFERESNGKLHTCRCDSCKNTQAHSDHGTAPRVPRKLHVLTAQSERGPYGRRMWKYRTKSVQPWICYLPSLTCNLREYLHTAAPPPPLKCLSRVRPNSNWFENMPIAHKCIVRATVREYLFRSRYYTLTQTHIYPTVKMCHPSAGPASIGIFISVCYSMNFDLHRMRICSMFMFIACGYHSLRIGVWKWATHSRHFIRSQIENMMEKTCLKNRNLIFRRIENVCFLLECICNWQKNWLNEKYLPTQSVGYAFYIQARVWSRAGTDDVALIRSESKTK